MKNMIWSSDDLYAIQDALVEDEGISEEEAWDMACEDLAANLEDEVCNLKDVGNGHLVATGTLVRWNGSGQAYKMLKSGNAGKAITEVMGSFDGDNSFNVYVEDGDLFISQLGHDNPTNPSVFRIRAVKQPLTEDMDRDEDAIYGASPEEIDARTEKLGRKIAEVYGWDMEAAS